MKKFTTALLILATMAGFSFLLFAPAYGQEGVATATPTQRMEYLPTLTTQTAPVSGVSRDALQKYANAGIETKTINEIEMSVSNFRIEDNFLKVNICFAAPDNRQWTIGEGFAQVGDNKLLLLESQNLETSRTLDNGTGQVTVISDKNINVEKTNSSVPNYRCDTLVFVVNEEQRIYSGAISLTVKYINAFPSVGQLCAPVGIAQSLLDEKNLGIKIACTETGSNGLSGVEIKILEKPQDMSEEQAQQYIAEARREATTIDGPWVFERTVTGAGNP
jgi:hypothetical protein